jgi:phospholipase C
MITRKWIHCMLALMVAISPLFSVPLRAGARHEGDAPTTTPIKHVVVIFQENVSFDHYFGTYPYALNPGGEPEFRAKGDTPSVNNLLSAGLLTHNPNGVNPFRIDRSVPVTCDENHNYQDEEYVFHGGLMDLFTSTLPYKTPPTTPFSCNDVKLGPNSVMGYYDGNTVTALWNYAQYFAMSDNSFGTTFGPSTPGALNLISGNTFLATLVPKRPNGTTASASGNIANAASTGAVIGDPRPGYDDCVLTNGKLQATNMITVAGKNVGDLLNAKGLTWGWFQGGFAPTGTQAGTDEFGMKRALAVCGSHNTGIAGDDALTTVGDYIPHHEPFEYYLQTSNIQHLRPSSPKMIGRTDQANHQYDLTDFFTALREDHLPAVTFLKAGAYQDGHAQYSDPLDEQTFLVDTINAIMRSDEWTETAIIIAYDDSDGWYDHVMGPIVNPSNVSDDELLGPGSCGTPKAIPGAATIQNGRCGYGPRMPLLVISPWAKKNYVDHNVTDQSSILSFIEDNWNLGRIGGGSTDAIAGTLNGMFDFGDDRGDRRGDDRGDWRANDHGTRRVILDPVSGEVLDDDAR